VTRIETIRNEVIAAAKAYAEAKEREQPGSRPSDRRVLSAAWALLNYEADAEERHSEMASERGFTLSHFGKEAQLR
jgi:hypothetical protein